MRIQLAAACFFIACGAVFGSVDQTTAAPRVCFDYPYPGEAVTDFIKRSSPISLIRVAAVRDVDDTQWAGDNVEFDLVALGTVKGKGPKQFSIRGLRSASADQLKFRGIPADHASLGKMTYRTIGGQSVLAQRKAGGICEFVPIMKVGHTYLVFLGGPTPAKSFEEVRDYRTDQWYASVLQELAFQLWEERHPEDRVPRNR